MLEIRITDEESGDSRVRVAVNPFGGLKLPKEGIVARLRRRTEEEGKEVFDVETAAGNRFAVEAPAGPDAKLAAVEQVFERLAEADIKLETNEHLWPEKGSKIRIINEGSHPDREHFGNYRVEHQDRVVGTIENHQKGQGLLCLLRKALNLINKG